MEIQYVYTKKRSEFGRQCLFSDVPAQIVLDIAPDCTQLQNYILREPCEIATQCVKEMSEHEVNTERAEYAIKGINHVEGGWPKDVNYAEPEQVARFRKKVEKEESYTKEVLNLGEILEACIKQNNAIDIYESYFEDAKETVGTDEQSELPSAKTLNVLRDPTKLKRAANHLSWSVDGSKLAVAYCSMEFNNNVPQSYDSFVWDIDAPNKFADRLSSQNSSICTLEYNPKDQHVILGGCLNGQICVWDTRKGSKPVSVSPVEKSHRDPAGSVLWMQTKTGNDCFTCSSDGQVFWWDVKKGMDDPVDSLVIDTTKKMELANALCCTTLEYESTMPTKFMVGTEQGTIVSCNRKAKTQADKIVASYNTHVGPIYSLERNPFNPKIFLTAADWTTRIWSEDIKDSSIVATKYHDCYISCAAWSPHRPAVFFVGRKDGYLDCWDLLFKQNSATLSTCVFGKSIRSIRPNPSKPGLLAVGSEDGQTALIQLSANFYKTNRAEKQSVGALFERETKREKILEGRQREMKLKERERSARIASAGSGNSKQQEESEEETDEVADSMDAFKQSLANYNKEMSTKHEINDEDLVIEDSEVKNE